MLPTRTIIFCDFVQNVFIHSKVFLVGCSGKKNMEKEIKGTKINILFSLLNNVLLFFNGFQQKK